MSGAGDAAGKSTPEADERDGRETPDRERDATERDETEREVAAGGRDGETVATGARDDGPEDVREAEAGPQGDAEDPPGDDDRSDGADAPAEADPADADGASDGVPEEVSGEPDMPPPRRRVPGGVRIAAGALAALLCFAGGYAFAGGFAERPGDNSAAAGFARDMQTHHAQAVQMSMIVRDRTDDERVRSLAYDIALTQQQQIGQMYAWLEQWDLPQMSAGPPMAWVNEGGHGHGGGRTDAPTASGAGGMPGMATPEQLRRLQQAQGREAEVLFLRLMIVHHEAGVQMAQAVLPRTDNEHVRRLASGMIAGQRSEIKLMQDMLRERGESP